MRIIGGKWRSRRIEWPTGGGTRPATDRLKCAIFDGLGCRYGTPGSLPGLCVADVFCGGGSMGLEAMSRGAEWACFFDLGRKALGVLQKNIKTLEAGPQARVVAGDLWRHGIRPPHDFPPLDLVFVDPPYKDARDTAVESKVSVLLRRLGESDSIGPETVVVFRHESKITWPDVIGDHWRVDSRRDYGRSEICVLLPDDGGAGVKSDGECDSDASGDEGHGGEQNGGDDTP